MKKIALFLTLLMPAMLFAQYQVSVAPDVPAKIKVAVPGYNEVIPAATIDMTFEFDATSETLLVRMGSNNASPNYDKVWLPQHDFSYGEMGDYMKTRGVKLKKAKTLVNQENFVNLGSRTIMAGLGTDGMTFTGTYDLKSPTPLKKAKDLDKQLVPLDGVMELDLKFNVAPRTKDVVLTLRNPMPMLRKGSKGEVAFIAEDVIINIELDRCKESQDLLDNIDEYLGMFEIGETRLAEMQRSSRSLMPKVQSILLDQYAEIDTKRFRNTGCEEVDAKLNELEECIERIRNLVSKSTPVQEPSSNASSCDVKKLNAEIKSTTTKLNNLVNDWSLASDASSKAEKKAAFDSTVKSFDAKLEGLPSGCKAKLDAKLLKNYEFVKKLIK